jgi:hypothetical protein
MAASTRTISPRTSSGTRQAGLRHWRELWELGRPARSMPASKPPFPGQEKGPCPIPHNWNTPRLAAVDLRKQRSTFAARLRCACRQLDSATFFPAASGRLRCFVDGISHCRPLLSRYETLYSPPYSLRPRDSNSRPDSGGTGWVIRSLWGSLRRTRVGRGRFLSLEGE